jgi:solute carrier family 35 protein E3
MELPELNVDAVAIGYMIFNFISSVGIILLNKVIVGAFRFPFMTFITMLHFIATSIGCRICMSMGIYKPKKLNHLDVLPITVAFCGFVVFNNLSLQHNPVHFYQLMKVLTTPVIVGLQYFFFGKTEDSRLLLVLVPVVVGVLLAVVHDVHINFLGTLYALAGIVATSFYQLWVKSKQQALKANPFQLLHYQAPQAAVVVAFVVPVFDDVFGKAGLLSQPLDHSLVLCIVVSSCLAFCVNLSIFLVIGKTSPLTYNILGHFKLVVILSSGILLFGNKTNTKQCIGMASAFVGIVGYSHLKMFIQSGWDAPLAKPPSSKAGGARVHAATTQSQNQAWIATKNPQLQEGRQSGSAAEMVTYIAPPVGEGGGVTRSGLVV